MPLDMTINVLNAPVPAHLSFPVGFEKTRFHKSKYVVNEATDEILGIVGKTFNCASHLKFFEGVQAMMCETLSDQDPSSVDVKWRSARGNAWAMMDLRHEQRRGEDRQREVPDHHQPAHRRSAWHRRFMLEPSVLRQHRCVLHERHDLRHV